MQKVYIVVPSNGVSWNNEAIVKQLRHHHIDRDLALKQAKDLAKQYDGGFYVLEMQEIVEFTPKITVLKSAYELSLEQ